MRGSQDTFLATGYKEEIEALQHSLVSLKEIHRQQLQEALEASTATEQQPQSLVSQPSTDLATVEATGDSTAVSVDAKTGGSTLSSVHVIGQQEMDVDHQDDSSVPTIECNECVSLRKQLQSLQNYRDEHVAERAALQKEQDKSKLEQEFEHLRTISDLKSTITELEAAASVMAQKCSENAETQETFVLQIKELTTVIARLEAEKIVILERLNALECENALIGSSVANVKEHTKEESMKWSAEVAQLQERLTHFEKLLRDNEMLQADLTKENEFLSIEVKNLTEGIKLLEDRIELILAESKASESEIAKLKIENENLCGELEEFESLNLNQISLKQEIEDLTEDLLKLKTQKEKILAVDAKNKNIADEKVLTELKTMSEELNDMRSKNEKLVDEASIFNPAKSSNSTDPATAHTLEEINSLEAKKQQLAAEIEDLRRRSGIFDMSESCEDSLATELSTNSAESIEKLQQNIKALTVEVTQLNNLREVLENRVSTQNSKIESLLEDHRTIRSEKEQLRLALESSDKCATEKRFDDSMISRQTSAMSAKLQEVEGDCERSLERLIELNRQKQELLSEIEQLRCKRSRVAEDGSEVHRQHLKRICSSNLQYKRRSSSVSCNDDVSFNSLIAITFNLDITLLHNPKDILVCAKGFVYQ